MGKQKSDNVMVVKSVRIDPKTYSKIRDQYGTLGDFIRQIEHDLRCESCEMIDQTTEECTVKMTDYDFPYQAWLCQKCREKKGIRF